MTLEKFFVTMSKTGMKVKKARDGLIFKKTNGSSYSLFYLRASEEGKPFLYYFMNGGSLFCDLEDVQFVEEKNGCQLRFDKELSIVGAKPPKGICSRELEKLMRKSARFA